MKYAYCYRSGEIEFTDNSSIDGAMLIAQGDEALMDLVRTRARQSYFGNTYLVPNVPEAVNEKDALGAYAYFRDWINGGDPKSLMEQYDIEGIRQRALSAALA